VNVFVIGPAMSSALRVLVLRIPAGLPLVSWPREAIYPRLVSGANRWSEAMWNLC